MGKSGRRRLSAGAERLFNGHTGPGARVWRRCYAALVKEFGEPAPRSLLAMDMSRVAACWVEVVEATSALEEARRRLSVGGRGHSRAEVRRLEARRLKADRGYGAFRAQLEQVGARARHEAMLARYGARP